MYIEEEHLRLSGKELQLRCPREEDAELLLEYLKRTAAETRYLVREPEEVTMSAEQERAFIRSRNSSKREVMLLGFLKGRHVGVCSLTGSGRSRYRHRVELAIALYQEFTGMGIGRAMVGRLIELAVEMGYEQMELEVAADNERAIGLYKDMGFEIYGTFPHNMKYRDGTYADAYWMMRKLV